MIVKLDNDNFSQIEFLLLSKKKVLEELKNNPFAKFLCYIQDNIVVAYIYYSFIYDRIEINNIEVEENYRNKKIATCLLKELISLNKDITLEVKVTNYIAIKLYEKFNFKKVAIRKGYYKGIDAILMEKKAEKRVE